MAQRWNEILLLVMRCCAPPEGVSWPKVASLFHMAKPDIVTSHFLPLAGASYRRFRPWFCWGVGVMFLGKQARRDAA